ncbi:MAG: hypothetical protein JWO67_4558 [Streptosporangiaceae bacterium]|nr:hypothetical protein [Streptosporangiaceae bacterium]
MTGPVPPGGEELRGAVGAELSRHRDVIELVDHEGVPDGNGDLLRYGCTCGHVRGVWTEREAIARLRQSLQEQRDHVAGEVARVAEEQGRRRAAEELRAAAEEIWRQNIGRTATHAALTARAAALAPEATP